MTTRRPRIKMVPNIVRRRQNLNRTTSNTTTASDGKTESTCEITAPIDLPTTEFPSKTFLNSENSSEIQSSSNVRTTETNITVLTDNTSKKNTPSESLQILLRVNENTAFNVSNPSAQQPLENSVKPIYMVVADSQSNTATSKKNDSNTQNISQTRKILILPRALIKPRHDTKRLNIIVVVPGSPKHLTTAKSPSSSCMNKERGSEIQNQSESNTESSTGGILRSLLTNGITRKSVAKPGSDANQNAQQSTENIIPIDPIVVGPQPNIILNKENASNTRTVAKPKINILSNVLLRPKIEISSNNTLMSNTTIASHEKKESTTIITPIDLTTVQSPSNTSVNKENESNINTESNILNEKENISEKVSKNKEENKTSEIKSKISQIRKSKRIEMAKAAKAAKVAAAAKKEAIAQNHKINLPIKKMPAAIKKYKKIKQSKKTKDLQPESQIVKLLPLSKKIKRNQGSSEQSEDDVVPNKSIIKSTSAKTGSTYKQRQHLDATRKLLEARREFKANFKTNAPDKSKLKLVDLIYYNPQTNPMPRKEATYSTPAKKVMSDEVDQSEENDSEEDNPVPQVRVDENGEIVLDEKSLWVEGTDAKRARKLAKSQIIQELEFERQGFYKHGKRGKSWSLEELLKFYRTLNRLGTDFSLMETEFPGRTRKELKNKFKREERVNGSLVNRVLQQPYLFNARELENQIIYGDDDDDNINKKEVQERTPKRGPKKYANGEANQRSAEHENKMDNCSALEDSIDAVLGNMNIIIQKSKRRKLEPTMSICDRIKFVPKKRKYSAKNNQNQLAQTNAEPKHSEPTLESQTLNMKEQTATTEITVEKNNVQPAQDINGTENRLREVSYEEAIASASTLQTDNILTVNDEERNKPINLHSGIIDSLLEYLVFSTDKNEQNQ